MDFKTELRKRSVALVEPKEKFIEWVKSVAHLDPLGWSADRIYPSSSCSAWLLKNSSSFPDYDAFKAYLESWKKDLLRVEVMSVYAGRSKFPCDITGDNFDEFFSLRVIDPVVPVEELDSSRS